MNTVMGVAVGDRAKVLDDEFVEAVKEKFSDMVIEGHQNAIVIAIATDGDSPQDVAIIYRLYKIRGVMEHCTIQPDTQEAMAIVALAEDVLNEVMDADRRGARSCAACMEGEDDEPPTLH